MQVVRLMGVKCPLKRELLKEKLKKYDRCKDYLKAGYLEVTEEAIIIKAEYEPDIKTISNKITLELWDLEKSKN